MGIENSKNIVVAKIDANGNVNIGDGTNIINLQETASYKELQKQLEQLNEWFSKVHYLCCEATFTL